MKEKKNPLPLRSTLWPFVVVATLLMAIPASYEPRHFAKLLLATACVQSAGYAVIMALLTRKSIGLQRTVLLLLALLFGIETFTFLRFGSRFNPAILGLVLQTTSREAKEFLTTYILHFPTLLYVLTAILAAVGLTFLIKPATADRGRTLLAALLMAIPACLLPLFTGCLGLPMGQNSLNELFNDLRFIQEKHGETELMATMIDHINVTETPDPTEAPVIVLVIGESFDRLHSSLYGYPLKTSPRMEKEQKEGRLTLFTHATTPTPATYEAMRYIFTLQGEEVTGDSTEYILMPAVFRKAGYHVAYLDNQYTRSSGGSFDYSCSYFLSPTAINDQCFDFRNEKTFAFDGDLVEHYADRLFLQSKSLNIIHLMGQHFDASLRYPDSFSHFTADSIRRNELTRQQRQQVAAYDNATLYNDFVLSAIIEKMKGINAVMVFISDHGEQIYAGPNLYFGRSFGGPSDEETVERVFRIPMFVWTSETFEEKHPDCLQVLREKADAPFSNADTPWLLFSLAGISLSVN